MFIGYGVLFILLCPESKVLTACYGCFVNIYRINELMKSVEKKLKDRVMVDQRMFQRK